MLSMEAEHICLHRSGILKSEWEQLQHERHSKDVARTA